MVYSNSILRREGLDFQLLNFLKVAHGVSYYGIVTISGDGGLRGMNIGDGVNIIAPVDKPSYSFSYGHQINHLSFITSKVAFTRYHY